MTRRTFAALAFTSCPSHGDVLAALAAEFGTVDPDVLDAQLDDHARRLFGIHSLPPLEQLQQLGATLRDGLHLTAESSGDLLLDRVLERRTGHPGVLAALGCELARRAGVTTQLYSSPQRWFAGTMRGERLWLLDADLTGPDPGPPAGVRRHCAHELAFCILSGLARRLATEGKRAAAKRAAQLRLALPLDEKVRAYARADLETFG